MRLSDRRWVNPMYSLSCFNLAFSGTKTVNGAVAFPPPAPTRIVSLFVVCVRAGSCTCGSSIIVVVVVGMDKTSPPPADISQLK